ncbi:cysteine--tRNA ligase [Nonomuraea pusilla]|uniref:cysteine--tRNA ligase n=1 Tax=Nonomuraea pusilla TaxID=46177 RepID=UPI00332E8613
MLRIHDARTGRVQEVRPSGALRLYVCGPSAHRYAHLGDLRAQLLPDLVRRVLERRRVRVVVCRGAADGVGGAPAERVRLHEEALSRDAAALNLRPPEYAPDAAESAGLAVDLVGELVGRGHAYATPGGAVFFDPKSISGGDDDSGGSAVAAGDWPLWTPGGDPSFGSPWGPGLPGPHVACSAAALRFLGGRVDVHVGPPSASREGALSEAAAGHEVVGHRLCGAGLLFEGRPMDGPAEAPAGGTGEGAEEGTEQGTAEGTAGGTAEGSVLLGDVTAAGLDPLAVRLAFLERHYRERADLSWEALRAADATLRRWRARVAEWAESPSAPMAAAYVERAESAFLDDLDTPSALAVLRELERDDSVAPGARFEAFLHLDLVLGLDLSTEIGKARVEGPARS